MGKPTKEGRAKAHELALAHPRENLFDMYCARESWDLRHGHAPLCTAIAELYDSALAEGEISVRAVS
jgi:hypothetical protein